MKKNPLYSVFFALLLACLPLGLAAINGHITTNTTWVTDTIVTGDLWVDENVTLTINPGVTVWFPKVDQDADTIGDTDFIVNGRLICNGTAENKVIFRSLEANPGHKDWVGITFTAGSSQSQSSLTNTEIHNAYRGILINGIGLQASGLKVLSGEDYGVRVQSTSSLSRFTNAVIEEMTLNGMTIETGSVSFTDVSISHNGGYGLKALNPVTISATRLNAVANAEHGLWLENTQSASFIDCRFNSNKANGVHIDRMSPSFDNCQINNNGWNGVYIFGNSGTPEFTNCTISENSSGVYFNARPAIMTFCNIENNGAGIGVYRNSPTINNSNIVGNGYGSNILINDFTSDYDWRTTNGAVSFPQTYNSHTNSIAFPMFVTSITYKKDGDYSSYSGWHRNHTRITANNEHLLVNEYDNQSNGHDMPETTVSGEINRFINDRNDLKLDLYYTFNCPNSRAWVTQIKYRLNYFSYINNLAGTVAQLQNNWWGQITGVDTLVTQEVPGTANYEGAMVSRIENAGCNLNNIPPTIVLTQPASLQINPESTTIAWIARDYDDNAEISLYYNSIMDLDGNLIVSGLSEDNVFSYVWDFAGISNGKYYIYAKIDDGVNPPVYCFAPGQVMVGPLSVQTEDCYAAAGDIIEVAIKAYNAYDDFDLNAFQLSLGYSHTLLNYLDTVVEGTMVEDWTVNSNGSVVGQVSVNGFSTEKLNGNGDLVIIRFSVAEGATDLQETELTISNFQYNNGNPEPVIESGVFRVRNRYNMSGWTKYYSNNNPVADVQIDCEGFADGMAVSDATGEFVFPAYFYGNYELSPSFIGSLPELLITPYDASMIARYALGLITFDAGQISAGNVDGDGDVDIYDAALIARYCVGLIPEFEAGVMKFTPQSHSFLLSPSYTHRTFNCIAVGDVSGNWESERGEQFNSNLVLNIVETENQVRLSALYPDPFFSIYSKLNYNSETLQYVGYEYSDGIAELNTTQSDKDASLRFAAFGVDAQQGDPEVVCFIFDKIGAYSEGDLEAGFFVFDEGSDTFTSAEDTSMPQITSLQQNYPNPFNPSTNFSFSLAKAQHVELSVYNLKGQKVQTLVDETIMAGNHRIVWNADGFGSGIYFARLETAEGYKKTIKMILLK